MKVKTAELVRQALDWAVTKCETTARGIHVGYLEPDTFLNSHTGLDFHYSTEWNRGGPIIEREGITVIRCDDDYGRDAKGFCNNVRIPVWAATTGQHSVQTSTDHQSHEAMYQVEESEVTYGPTPLIAAMRCFVASKFGDELEIPDEFQELTEAQESAPSFRP